MNGRNWGLNGGCNVIELGGEIKNYEHIAVNSLTLRMRNYIKPSTTFKKVMQLNLSG